MTLDYRTLFKDMNDAGVDYMLIGGVAVNFYGIPRMTSGPALTGSFDVFEISEETE